MLNKKANITNAPQRIAFPPYGLNDKPFLCGVNIYNMESSVNEKCWRCGGYNTCKNGYFKDNPYFYCNDCNRAFVKEEFRIRGIHSDFLCPRCNGDNTRYKTTRPDGKKVCFCRDCNRSFSEVYNRDIIRQTKKCITCKKDLPLSDFFLNKKNGYYASRCKQCTSHYNRNITYNITEVEFNSLFASQGGMCAICGKILVLYSKNGVAIDHDHKSGKIRGLLCRECNLMLGFSNDDVTILNSAIKYLDENIY